MRIVLTLAMAGLLGGCNWISLAVNSASYKTLEAGDAGNLVVVDTVAYVSLADSGFAVVSADAGSRLRVVAPPRGLSSVDDVAAADGLLFVLDARPPGSLAVYSLADRLNPTLIAPAIDVPVGPFSGVSAAHGVAVVSGGTSALSSWSYDATGALGDVAHIDLGRGQPDALVGDAGTVFVSTHYWGPYFGLDVVRRDSASLRVVARVRLTDAGFTTGGAKPANFPVEAALLDSATLLVAHRRGVAVLDVSRPDAARLVRVIDVGGPAVNVDAMDRVAAVSVGGGVPAVVLIDFRSGPAAVVRRVTLPSGTKPAGVALSRHSVLIAARGRGVLAVKR